MLNTVIVMGRLTGDPQLRQTQGAAAVTNFTLAVDRDFRSRDSGEIVRACSNLGIFCRVIGDAKAVGNALDATTTGMDAIYDLLGENA